jgi:cobalt-zinc-cadmium efflux system membrane fusion protein
MTLKLTRVLAALALSIGTSAAALAQGGSFALADEQIARLGVRLARPEAVQEMDIASAPAEVVVPTAQQALISAPVDGLVARMHAAEGEVVRRGQAVAELEGADFLDWQRLYLDALAEGELATAQEARDQSLYAEGIIAERRWQEAQARARAARVRLDQARRQLQLAGFSAADLERLATGGNLVARLVLHAPLDGVVLEQYAAVGARLAALDAVMRIGDLRVLWLELRVRQEVAAQIMPGMSVRVTLGGDELISTITTIGRNVDSTTQAVLVRAELEDPAGRLRAGQFLTVRIVAPLDGRSAFALPLAALTRIEGAAYVFVHRAGEIEVLPVEVLADDGSRVFVSGRLDANARVAVEGISALKSLWLQTQEEGS